MARGVVAGRYFVMAAVALAVYLHHLAITRDAGGDWFLFTLGASHLQTSQALHVFAKLPLLQTGPLSLVLSIPLSRLGPTNGWQVTSVLLFALALVLVRVVETAALRLPGPAPERVRAAALVGGCLLVLSWVGPAAIYGHPDDVFALLCIGIAVSACTERSWPGVAVAVGLAAAFKPWGIYFLPLAAVVDPRRWRGLLVAVAGAVLPWLPFVIADHGTLDVAHFHFITVGVASTLRLVGVDVGSSPHWVRGVQLLLALGLGTTAVVRRRWELLPWLVAASRVNLEVRWFEYYSCGVLAGALIVDCFRPTRLPGARTAIAWVLLYAVPRIVGHVGGTPADFVEIAARLVALLLPLVELVRSRERTAVAAAGSADAVVA